MHRYTVGSFDARVADAMEVRDGSSADAEVGSDELSSDNWEEVDVRPKKRRKKTSRRKKRKAFSEDEIVGAAQKHAFHLMSLLLRFSKEMSGIKAKVWFAMLSMVPSAVLPPFARDDGAYDSTAIEGEDLRRVTGWFYGTFRLVEKKSTRLQSLSTSNMVRSIHSKSGSKMQLVFLFAGLSAALGYPSRVVRSFHRMLPWKPGRATSKRQTSSDSSEWARSCWCEVWTNVSSTQIGRWVAVDPTQNVVQVSGADMNALLRCPRGAPPSQSRRNEKIIKATYVVAAENVPSRTVSKSLGFVLMDVTRRYAVRWSKCRKRGILDRMGEWYDTALRELSDRGTFASDCGEDEASWSEKRHRRLAVEEQRLLKLVHSEKMPTNLEGFKRHPVYCLEEHLGTRRIVREEDRDRAIAGMFKGRTVMLRAHVHDLLSSDMWFRKHLRVVRQDEIDKPYRTLRKSSGNAKETTAAAAASSSTASGQTVAAALAALADARNQIRLYGRWQTDTWSRPVAKGGIVPRNRFGNVEVWSPAHLPVGTVQIRSPHVKKCADLLGIDNADALVGFERRNGRTTPRFEGVVVCVEFVPMLADACREKEAEHQEELRRKRYVGILRRWRRLTKSLLLRAFVSAQFDAVE
eukprot:g865.t1